MAGGLHVPSLPYTPLGSLRYTIFDRNVFFGYYFMDHVQIFVDSLKTFGHVGQNGQESYKLWLMDVLRQYDEFKNK
jgi:hypothetical protein